MEQGDAPKAHRFRGSTARSDRARLGVFVGDNVMEHRLGIIGIVVQDRKNNAAKVNEILGQFGDIIVGRIGVPYRDRGISVIGLIVEASTDQLGAMTGKLGMLPKVKVRSILV